MATSRKPRVDYLTLLGYVNELGIKVYDLSDVNFDTSDGELGHGNSMTVLRATLVKDTETLDSIQVAVKVPRNDIKESSNDFRISKVLSDVRQELRMMKHFD